MPLVLPCDQRMSERNQEALIVFVKAGGKLILTPVIPEFDEASGIPVIQHEKLGDGQVILLGAAYDYNQFCQMDMLELCLETLGTERLVHTDSKEQMVTLFRKIFCFSYKP